jgi:hypothetical protein
MSVLQEGAIDDAVKNGGVKLWHLATAFAAFIVWGGTVMLTVGAKMAEVDVRLLRAETDISDTRLNYERRDVMDERLLAVETELKRIEDSEKTQADTLEEIRKRLRR